MKFTVGAAERSATEVPDESHQTVMISTKTLDLSRMVVIKKDKATRKPALLHSHSHSRAGA